MHQANYDYVTDLPVITQRVLKAAEGRIIGTHTDNIVSEAGVFIDREKVSKNGIDKCLMCSFPDAYKDSKGFKCIFLRSEFLILRYLGNKIIDFKQANNYLGFLKDKIINHFPKKVIYRLCDYNEEDFHFLPTSYPDKRGANRLMTDTELLNLDLKVIKLLIEAEIEVCVMIPYCILNDTYTYIKTKLEKNFEYTDKFSIGLFVDTPANIKTLEMYDAKTFMFAASDLTCNYYGISRNDPIFPKVDVSIMVEDIKAAIKKKTNCTFNVLKTLIGKINQEEFPNNKIVNYYMPTQLV